MHLEAIIKELKDFGTAQNKKIYVRHGVKQPLYGVSYANIKKLAKKIKIDQSLSEKLWATKNHDARILATHIANVQEITPIILTKWSNDLNNYVITDAFASLASKTDFNFNLMKKWIASNEEWIGRAGWLILAHNAIHYAETKEIESFFESCLETIQKTIHSKKNRTKDAMNSALIAIGSKEGYFKKKAILTARAIGKLEVDHGETSCKTPDAESYIEKIHDRKRKK